ncbi:hypothetical protein AAHH80_33675, partial [Burkholderia pseudomallei]
PFDRIAVQCANASGSLFQTMFDLDAQPRAHDARTADGDGLRAELLDGAPLAPIADLSVTLRETAQGLSLSCVYAAERFDAPAVERWLE